METVFCNLCGSDEHELVYRMPDAQFHPDEWFSVVACRGCGLGFVNPRPSADEMARYYPPAYYDYFEVEPDFHERRYAAEAHFVEEAVAPAGATRRLLDIGCANGGFPRFMRARGWDVEGVEISDDAREIDDFPVYRSDFASAPLEGARYDAATAWAVLEHVHDPMAYFRKAAEILKPGGAFLFHVTNFESISSRRLFHEDVPRHLYFFTEGCVRRYLREAGLALERADYDDSVYGMNPANWLVYALRRLRGKPFRWEHGRVSRQSYLASAGLDPGWKGTIRFALRHPIVTVDRATMPIYARLQMLRRSYGVVTYRARKPD